MVRQGNKPAASRRDSGSSLPRISKQGFLDDVAAETGVERDVVERVYEEIISGIISGTAAGNSVVLAGFGRFYPQVHKGHRVQFGDSDERIPDYSVLKFSSARNTNRLLDELRTSGV